MAVIGHFLTSKPDSFYVRDRLFLRDRTAPFTLQPEALTPSNDPSLRTGTIQRLRQRTIKSPKGFSSRERGLRTRTIPGARSNRAQEESRDGLICRAGKR